MIILKKGEANLCCLQNSSTFTKVLNALPTDGNTRAMATAGDRYEERTGNIWSYAHRGDMTGLKAAVVRGVDVNMTNTVGWTACHAAAAGGQTKALRYLIKKMNADLSIADKGGNLAVHHAAKNGHVHALRTLQEFGADLTRVRLSQTKGKAVRELVVASYRKAGKTDMEDGDDDIVDPVGYARKQSKSTAFWGPRRTPISCSIKKKIIKDKRKARKEKQKARRESNNEMKPSDLEKEATAVEEEAEDEPSYEATVQEIKRRRKQKRRQRQKQKQKNCAADDSIDNLEIAIRNELRIDDVEDSSEESDSGDQNSSRCRFAALVLTEYDSDST